MIPARGTWRSTPGLLDGGGTGCRSRSARSLSARRAVTGWDRARAGLGGAQDHPASSHLGPEPPARSCGFPRWRQSDGFPGHARAPRSARLDRRGRLPGHSGPGPSWHPAEWPWTGGASPRPPCLVGMVVSLKSGVRAGLRSAAERAPASTRYRSVSPSPRTRVKKRGAARRRPTLPR
jgi:hypothetical protein